jgi:hypothetical protein
MRYRLMASYLGASYQAAVGPSDRDVTLFAAPPPPEEHGFSPAPGGIWRKQVRLDDLDGLWESRPIGSYHGEPCLVLDDLGDRLHIVYLGMDGQRAAQLGYWEVDRGVFEVVVPRIDSCCRRCQGRSRRHWARAIQLAGATASAGRSARASATRASATRAQAWPARARTAWARRPPPRAGVLSPGPGSRPGASSRRSVRRRFPRRCRSSRRSRLGSNR